MSIIIFMYYIIAIPYLIYTFKKNYISPSFIFLGMQTVMFSGILRYVNFGIGSDLRLIKIYFVALIMFILGDLLSRFFYPTKNLPFEISGDRLNVKQRFWVGLLVFVSVVACVYFFIASGYNVFVEILSSIADGGVNDYTDERIALYSIKGVGYIYQFRVTVLPVLCAFLITSPKNPVFRLIGKLCFPFMIIFLLGTGQRLGFIVFVVIFLVALMYVYKVYNNKRIKFAIILISVGAVFIFMVMTVFNGRVQSDSNIIESVMSRIFNENQECAVVAFRYIDSQPTQWGRDWYLSMLDILPGKNDYKQLSYVVFEVMYGTDRGTSPPCIWGSAYYNFGWLGVLFMPFIMGIVYHRLYFGFRRYKMNRLRIFLYSAMFVILGLWFADNPLYLFNQGFITIVIMMLLLKPTKKQKDVKA